MLVGVKWDFNLTGSRTSTAGSERLRRLAKSLDALNRRDENDIRKAHEIGALRRQAAVDLHGICGGFVRDLNKLLQEIELEFQPADYRLESFQDSGLNLFQINARGRIL